MGKTEVGSFAQLLHDDIIPDGDTTDHALGCRAKTQVRGEGLSGLADFSFGRLQMVLGSNLSNFQDIVHILDISLHVAQERSSGVGIFFPASSVASVPIIQAAVAATLWSRVAACSLSGSTS